MGLQRKRFASVVWLVVLLMAFSPCYGALGEASDPSETGTVGAQAVEPEEEAAPSEDGAASWLRRTMDIRLFADDQTLDMPKNSRSFWMVVPAGVVPVDDVKLSLHVSYSNTLIEERSSLMVYVNEVPIATHGIVSEGERDYVWEVRFDNSLLRLEGYNEIKLTTVQRSIEGECADIDNPLNWVVIHDDSKLSISIDMATDPLIKDYNNLFYGSFSEQYSIVADQVLEDVADIDQVSAALGIVNAAGMTYPDRETVKFRVFDHQVTDKANNNRIYIGKGDGGASGKSEISLNGVTRSAPYYKLSIQSPTTQGLKTIVNFLSNSKLMEQSEEQTLELTRTIAARNASTYVRMSDSGMYTFEKLGFSDVELEGAFHQHVNFTIVQPEGVRGEAGSYITIAFRHSEALLSERSLLNVSINGVLIDSVKLTPANTDGGTLVVDIPEEALRGSSIDLSLQAYHYLGKVDCEKDYYDVAWTVIDAEQSKVYLAEARRIVEPTLSGFPTVRDPSEEPEVQLYLPGAPDCDRVELCAMLSARLGQNSGQVFGWNVVNGNVEAGATGNVLIIGNRDSVHLPEELAQRLSIVPSDAGYRVVDENLDVVTENLNDKAILQVVNSPWDALRKIYVVLYDSEEALNRLKGLFETKTRMYALGGQVALVGRGGSVVALSTAETSAPEDAIPMELTDYVKQFEAIVGMAWWIVLLIAVTVIVVIVTIIRLVRNRKNDLKEKIDQHRKEQGFDGERDEEEDFTEK